MPADLCPKQIDRSEVVVFERNLDATITKRFGGVSFTENVDTRRLVLQTSTKQTLSIAPKPAATPPSSLSDPFVRSR